MKLDRRQLRRIINEEASMLGISLNEIMGRGGFNEPISIVFNPNADVQLGLGTRDPMGRTGRFEVVGAIYTDAGKPVVMSPRNDVKLVLNVYDFPKTQPLYDEDTGEIVKGKHMTFKFVDVNTGTFLNSKEAARMMTGMEGENFNSVIGQAAAAWSTWIDMQPKDQAFEWLDQHSRVDITNPGTGGTSTRAAPARALSMQDKVAQSLGLQSARGTGPSAAPSRAAASAPVTRSPAAESMLAKVNALINAADAMQALLDDSDETSMIAIEEYIAARSAFRRD